MMFVTKEKWDILIRKIIEYLVLLDKCVSLIQRHLGTWNNWDTQFSCQLWFRETDINIICWCCFFFSNWICRPRASRDKRQMVHYFPCPLWLRNSEIVFRIISWCSCCWFSWAIELMLCLRTGPVSGHGLCLDSKSSSGGILRAWWSGIIIQRSNLHECIIVSCTVDTKEYDIVAFYIYRTHPLISWILNIFLYQWNGGYYGTTITFQFHPELKQNRVRVENGICWAQLIYSTLNW